eukprot:scaffold85733_cov21-Tisochrysis_lutea.AAC.1
MHSLCRRLAVSFRSHRVTLTLKPSCHTHTKAMHSLCRRLAVSESIVRLAVSEALSTSPHVRPWTQAAMGAVAVLPEGPMRSMYLNLGLKVIYGWCVRASTSVSAVRMWRSSKRAAHTWSVSWARYPCASSSRSPSCS